ncbi:DUF6299 family protein [Streptomyces sp. XD-27]|uniref:DUF6299 family protein n=1 Tax=Streptomyces sp. XD-27 TaxID=3062779 RepID=UPI0026F4396C|nr:DUF6299 family protein [Streptomyces sp. XD-27]WKX70159.1 DUF6299 family protein [Streptomyces sp. XD-27]
MRIRFRRAAPAVLGAALLAAAAPLPAAAAPGRAAAPAPEQGYELTIDPRGYVGPNGSIRLSGTYRCTKGGAVGLTFISSTLEQGDQQRGIGGTAADCDGKVHRWTNTDNAALIVGESYAPGKARVKATILRLSMESGLPLPDVLTAEQQSVQMVSGSGA